MDSNKPFVSEGYVTFLLGLWLPDKTLELKETIWQMKTDTCLEYRDVARNIINIRTLESLSPMLVIGSADLILCLAEKL
jgi:hypothetical protein